MGEDFGVPSKAVQLDFLGLDDAALAAVSVLYWPFDRRNLYITQSFIPGKHYGLDIGISRRTKLYNPLPVRSQIVRIGWDNTGYGNMVALKAGKWYIILGHLDQINPDLRVGNWVDPMAFLGWSDSTGNSTGDHLHLELRESNTGYFPFPSSCKNPAHYMRWYDQATTPPPTPTEPPDTDQGWHTAVAQFELRMYRKQKFNTVLEWPRIAAGATIQISNRKKVGNVQWAILQNGFFTPKKIGPTRYLKNV